RLIVCSLDKAQEIGMDWWKFDHHFAPGRQPQAFENEQLKRQVRALERKISELSGGFGRVPRRRRRLT
ncbi:MAG TPA: hypothetical protein VH208_07235, partial [Myxococcaceae bacterium]|nr:hypothetical protein [Myxococcaceae bacterium]